MGMERCYRVQVGTLRVVYSNVSWKRRKLSEYWIFIASENVCQNIPWCSPWWIGLRYTDRCMRWDQTSKQASSMRPEIFTGKWVDLDRRRHNKLGNVWEKSETKAYQVQQRWPTGMPRCTLTSATCTKPFSLRIRSEFPVTPSEPRGTFRQQKSTNSLRG